MQNTQMVFLILLMAVMYFFFVLPQVRRGKKQREYREALGKGDRIVTTGGIHGKITEIKDLTVTIDTGNGNKLKIDRSATNMEASELAYPSSSES